MEREEAKQDLYYGIQFDTLKIDKFIDKIYDDFESRTCGNCKYNQKYDNSCNNSFVNNILSTSYIGTASLKCVSDFGCNKFKRKEE